MGGEENMPATSYDTQVSDVLERVLSKPDCEEDMEQVVLRAKQFAGNGNDHPQPSSNGRILKNIQGKDAVVSFKRPSICSKLPSVLETSSGTSANSARSNAANRTSPRPSHRGIRNPSPAPSCSSSSVSAVTTLATLSSRSSLSACRPSGSGQPGSRRGSISGDCVRPSTRSKSRCSPAATSDGFLPPASRDPTWRRRRWNGVDRSCPREVGRRRGYSRRWSDKDYASEASSPRGRSSSRGKNGSGYSRRRKRSRSCSRERQIRSKVDRGSMECPRCLEWCRASRERKITRTLPMEYWVRTPTCKAAKSKHMEYMDKMTYSREQFIEETVFTCPMTGVQRETLLERNMFPYDVPTDVEHWTLWSRKDLDQTELEEFVQTWAAENHPHVVEWECDNNEGDRSIDWYHVHVFFRLGCEDKTGVPRDPSSAYRGPCGTPACCTERSSEDSEHRDGNTSEEVMMANCEKPLDCC